MHITEDTQTISQQTMRQCPLYQNMKAAERLNTCTEILGLRQVDPADMPLIPDLVVTSLGCSARSTAQRQASNLHALKYLHIFLKFSAPSCWFSKKKPASAAVAVLLQPQVLLLLQTTRSLSYMSWAQGGA